MDNRRRNRFIANSFYNLGLEKAGLRDLTGAVMALKRSLQFDKYQTDARNLLGLIYYEIGEVADALVQWVISMNLQPQDNRASYYLEEVQGKSGYMGTADQVVKKYNQALIHAQSGSDDLAVLQLTRVVEISPHFVKAHLLLALLYIMHEEYTKAGKSLYRVLQLDRNNPKAQWYMSVVKEKTGKAEIEKKKLKNAFSHRQMQDDDIIIPPSYKENTGWQSILNIIAGLLIGAAVIFFLVMPANDRVIAEKHRQELIEYNEKLNKKNQEITKLEDEIKTAQEAQQKAEGDLAAMANDSGGVLGQYQTLIKILEAYRAEDLNTAALLYVDLTPDVLRDGVINSTIDWVQADMNEKASQILLTLGETAAAQEGHQQESLDYLQKSLKLDPENPQILYDIGLVYQMLGDEEQANEYFGQVIMNYPNSDQAPLAKERRGY